MLSNRTDWRARHSDRVPEREGPQEDGHLSSRSRQRAKCARRSARIDLCPASVPFFRSLLLHTSHVDYISLVATSYRWYEKMYGCTRRIYTETWSRRSHVAPALGLYYFRFRLRNCYLRGYNANGNEILCSLSARRNVLTFAVFRCAARIMH